MAHQQAAGVALLQRVACYEFVGKWVIVVVDTYVGRIHRFLVSGGNWTAKLMKKAYICAVFQPDHTSDMLILILIMLAGVIAGRLVLRRARLNISPIMLVTVCLLVGVLGFTVGADPEIVAALPKVGLQSLILGVCATLGAIGGTLLLIKLLRR